MEVGEKMPSELNVDLIPCSHCDSTVDFMFFVILFE